MKLLLESFKWHKKSDFDSIAFLKNKSSYRSIIKGTAIFGGVQVFQIVITVIRGKIIAILLGPAGSGIAALLSSTINIIAKFSSLGLNFSAVREISQANELGDIPKLSRVVQIFRRWVWFTGFLGGLISLLFARLFSESAFGNADYTWGFVCLSISLLLNALASGETSLLQGTRQLRSMAQSSVIGSFIGLLTAIPLYYYWNVKGIVPAIIIASISAYAVNRYFARKIQLAKGAFITIYETLAEGKQMAKLGIVLMITQVLGTFVIYIINLFISQRGGIIDVGLYQSGTLITSYSFGLVFNSMDVDYFPRLTAVSNDTIKLREVVNQQAVLIILIITPLLIGVIIFAHVLIRILLSVEYLPAIPMVQWICLGMILKAASYALGYISFAKGDKNTFFWLDGVFGNIQSLILNIICYTLWGIEGLGIALLLCSVFYMIVLTFVAYRKFDFRFNREFWFIFILQTLLCLTVFADVKIVANQWLSYIFGIILFGGSLWYSWQELDKKIDIRNLLLAKFKNSE